jgi:hypothetical protein
MQNEEESVKPDFFSYGENPGKKSVNNSREVNMIFAILIIGLVLLLIFRPRLAFLFFRMVWLFLPEITGAIIFFLTFRWLCRKCPIPSVSEHMTFLTICILICGAVVGRKVFMLYITPHLPEGLLKRSNDGRN